MRALFSDAMVFVLIRYQGTMTDREAPAVEGVQAGYVEVAGLPTWHEVRGRGPAVVLLHGAFSGAAGWSAQAPALADDKSQAIRVLFCAAAAFMLHRADLPG